MGKENTIPARVDPIFKKMVEDLRLERFKLGKDNKPKSFPRITRAITNAIIRTPGFNNFLREARIDD